MKKPKTKHTQNKSHLSDVERIIIQNELDHNTSPYQIAQKLSKSPSTIVREIRNHSIIKKAKGNDCLERKDCTLHSVCKRKHCTQYLCKKCKAKCTRWCEDYIKEYCEKLQQSPHVCNGCKSINSCNYERVIYDGKEANKQYRAEMIDKRAGFDLTCEELTGIDKLVTPLIQKGQSPYHIKQTLGERLPVRESTLYRLINSGILECRNIDLHEKVKRKPRKSQRHSKDAYAILTAAKIGHLYSDYLSYIKDNDVLVVQMDCVEGIKTDSAVLLTLHYPSVHMQLAFIMDEQTSECVVGMLDRIENALGDELFKEMFPVILTDNGHEFADIAGMERSIYGGQRTKVFFCEPNRSDEKGACENNHKLIRNILPKGQSLEPYSQMDINNVINHVNSYCRKSIGGLCPYDLAFNAFPEDFFILLGLEKIPSEDVVISPALLKQFRSSS